MKTIGVLAAILFVVTATPALTAGACSTGNYNTCVSCCKQNPSASERSTCLYQCEGYKSAIRGGVLKAEPGPGQIAAGARVLVDDGSCPKGQIKEVTGGTNYGGGSKNRTIRCVRRR
jgi:hypothetical protein